MYSFVHWEQLTPQQEIAFCPVALDSISWVRKEVFDTLDRYDAVDGANGLIQLFSGAPPALGGVRAERTQTP